MEQKIKVEVAPAANDKWPKCLSISSDIPIGTRFIVQLSDVSPNRVTLYLLRDGAMWNVQDRSITQFPMVSSGQRICFLDFEMAAEWWLNPKPVKAEPEKVMVRDLKSGDFFTDQGILYRIAESFYDDPSKIIDCKFGGFATAGPTHLVTPFKGTVTITVE